MIPRDDIRRAIESIARLRRAERLADESLRGEIADAREFLEGLVGPTVRPADAARLLGVSQPALHRWIENGEISTVISPEGRREIPLSELVQLLDDIEKLDAKGARPISRLVRERHRRSNEDIDIDRLLPRRRPRDHRLPELQALAYHRLIGERLDEQLVDEARRRLARWRVSGRIDPRWADAWARLLTKPIPGVAKAIGADTKRARELRQTSPFAGALTEQERQRLLRAVEQRFSG
jgi:hypothetical protein